MKTAIIAAIAAIATVSAEPIPNVDKLTTRAVGMGKNKVVEITAKADKEPLVIVWGVGKEDRMTVPAGETKTRKVGLQATYKVTASENGTVVDTESNTRKTGIQQDRKLR